MDHKRRRTDGFGPPGMNFPRGGAGGFGGGGGGGGFMNDIGGFNDGYGPMSGGPDFGAQGVPQGFQQGGGPPAFGGGGMGMGGPGPGQMGMLGYERIFPCVKLRGLPFDVQEDDIRLFLGNEPLDVVLAKRNGRFTGEAFAVFTAPLQVEAALRKDKTYLGRRYVEVFKAKKWDYYRAVASVMAEFEGGGRGYGGGGYHGGHDGGGHVKHDHGGHHGNNGTPGSAARGSNHSARSQEGSDGIVKLRGLPFNATVQDVVQFFNDGQLELQRKVVSADVHMVIDMDGRPSGHAYVAFDSQQDAETAMTKNKQMIGTRYIEIFPSTREEAAKAGTRRMGGR